MSALSDVADLGGTVNAASRRGRPLLGPFAETKGPRLPGRNPALLHSPPHRQSCINNNSVHYSMGWVA